MSSDAVELTPVAISPEEKKGIERIIITMLGQDRLVKLLQEVRREFSIPSAEVIISFLYAEPWDFPGAFIYLPGCNLPKKQFISSQGRIEMLLNTIALAATTTAIRQKTFYTREPRPGEDFPHTSIRLSHLIEKSPIFDEEWFWFLTEYLMPEVHDQAKEPTFIHTLRYIEGDLVDPVYRRCSTDSLVSILPSFALSVKNGDYLCSLLKNERGQLARILHMWAQSALMPQETNRGC